MGINVNRLVAGLRNAPMASLKAASMQAKIAIENREYGALITAAGSAAQAAHDILSQGKQLVRGTDDDSLPVALQVPQELTELAESITGAFEVASAIPVACEKPQLAAALLKDAVATLKGMRQSLATCYDDPELMLRRSKIDATLDTVLMASGRALRDAVHRCQGRQVLIDLGVIGPDPNGQELEVSVPQEGLAFQTVPVDMHANEGRTG